MIKVNNEYHNLITDGSTKQILLMTEVDEDDKQVGNIYLSSDGDFSSDDPAEFVDEMKGDSYGLGVVTCRTLTATIMNLDHALDGHNFGWLRAYIGVRYWHEETTFDADTYAEIHYQGTEQEWDGLYACKTNGFYRNGVRIGLPCDCRGAITFDDGYFYYFVESRGAIAVHVYDAENDTILPDSETPKNITEMARKKVADGRFILVDPNYQVFADVHDGYEDWYYIACLGNFRVDKPKRTLGDTIRITDAFDLVHNLDVDSGAVLALLEDTDGKSLMETLCEGCGLSVSYSNFVIANRLSEISVTAAYLKRNSYTCRRLVSFLCEAVGCNARLLEGTKKLHIYMPDRETASMAYPITGDRIEVNGFEAQEFTTPVVTCVSVKTLKDETLQFPRGGGDYTYCFEGNPFVEKATQYLYNYVRQIPTYVPCTVSVLEADPSFQCGDFVSLLLSDGTEDTLTTYEREDILTYDEEEIIVAPHTGKYVFPIMSQTIRWNVFTTATYEAKGSLDMVAQTYDDYSDTNARTSKQISADFIVGGTIRGVDIIGTNVTGDSTFACGEIITIDGSDYSQSDLARLDDIILGRVTPTSADYLHLDVNKDRVFDYLDYDAIEEAIQEGTATIDKRVTIDSSRSDEKLMTCGETELGSRRVYTKHLESFDLTVEKRAKVNQDGDTQDVALDATGVIQSTYGVFKRALNVGDPEGTVYFLASSGGLKVNDHSSFIGSIVSASLSSNTAVSANTDTALCSVTLDKGIWLMYGYVKWAGVSSAVRRYINISATSGASNARIRTDAYTEANAQFQMECSGYLEVTTDSKPYYLNAYTTVAGNALATYTQLNAVRLL